MIEYKKHVLKNGLRVIVHRDESSPLAVFHVAYGVGSKNENPERTGFAHLFEHLMFGGSQNIPDFDTPLQKVGAENNAYTDEDTTNYYITIPAQNIETAFWVESDRMNMLAFSPESLEVQRKVVMEEFKQRCLNQPYGDILHLINDMAYKVHPYRWPVIGAKLDHIAEAKMEDVKKFFFDNYTPDNAVVAIAGNVDPDKMFALAEKWFGDIDRKRVVYDIPKEPIQTEQRIVSVERDVPANLIYMVYHIGKHTDRNHFVMDMATDVLAYGPSSRLIQRLVHKEQLVSDVDSGINDTLDPGLLTFSATLLPGVTFSKVESVFREEIDKIINSGISEYELQKVKNRTESDKVFSEISIKLKARGLANCELIGDANLINTDIEMYNSVTSREISESFAEICRKTNESILYYNSKSLKDDIG